MENKRTILEYLNSLKEDSKQKKKETTKVSKPDTSKYVDISEINKLFDTFTIDIKKLSNHLKKTSDSSNRLYIKGEINALEYSRDTVTNIIEKHLK